VALAGVLSPGCAQLQDLFAPLRVGDWPALVEDIRTFERRIGFQPTHNFRRFAPEESAYSFCGYASRFVLPYSYEDPAIRWAVAETREQCGEMGGPGADSYFATVEVLGETGAQVTAAMAGSRLERFLYVVLHEDCHDQFDLPYGVEEALCDVLAYRAMAVFADERFGSRAREDRTVRRYGDVESRRARETKEYYEQLERLYVRYERKEVSSERLLGERERIFATAGRAIAWKGAPLNNVVMANHMTYSRHYPFLEGVLEAHDYDLARAVAFFREVDRAKPAPAAVMRQHAIGSEKSAAFLRAYEAAVIETMRKALAARGITITPR